MSGAGPAGGAPWWHAPDVREEVADEAVNAGVCQGQRIAVFLRRERRRPAGADLAALVRDGGPRLMSLQERLSVGIQLIVNKYDPDDDPAVRAGASGEMLAEAVELAVAEALRQVDEVPREDRRPRPPARTASMSEVLRTRTPRSKR